MSCPYNNCKCKWVCLCLPPPKDEYKPLARIMWLLMINDIEVAGKSFDYGIQKLMDLNSEFIEQQLLEIRIEKGKHYVITPDGCIAEIIQENEEDE